MNKILASIIILSLWSISARSDSTSVTIKISDLIKEHHLRGGVFMKALDSGASIKILEDKMFPMASVFKLPIAIAILHQVDQQSLTLNQKIVVTKKDIVGGVKGPIARRYNGKNLVYSLAEILRLMVSESDNTACDILIRLGGGPKAITQYLRGSGIEGINVSRYESQILAEGSEPGVMELDAATPVAIEQLYEKLNEGSLLKSSSKESLLQMMISSNTPPHIKRGLPESYVIANKSGWCGELCVNDTALVTNLTSQKKYVLVIFLYGKSNYQESSDLIAKITQLGMSEFVKTLSANPK